MPTGYHNEEDWSFRPNKNFNDEPPVTEDERLWELLSVYADGEATPEEAAQVESLLRSDAAYARDFAFLQASTKGFQVFGEVDTPISLRASILAATTQRPTFSRRLASAWSGLVTGFPLRPARLAFAGGSLAAASLLAFAFWPRSGNNVPNLGGTGNGPTVIAKVPAGTQVSPSVGQKSGESPRMASIINETNDPGTGKINIAGKPQAKTPEKSLRPATNVAANDEDKPEISPVKINVGPSPLRRREPKFSVANTVQKAAPDANKDTMQVAIVEYNPVPMMDKTNQRPVLAVRTGEKLDVPDVRDAGSDNGSEATLRPASNDGVRLASAPEKRVRYGKLLSMPPDTRHLLSTEAIRRQTDAANLGYNRAVVDSIERNQPTPAIFGRF